MNRQQYTEQRLTDRKELLRVRINLLFITTRKKLWLTYIIMSLGDPPGKIRRELDVMVALGLVNTAKIGNRRYYSSSFVQLKLIKNTPIKLSKTVIRNRRLYRMINIAKQKKQYFRLLKPWKDPDSLFCDTSFLEKPLGEGGLGIKVKKSKKCDDDRML